MTTNKSSQTRAQQFDTLALGGRTSLTQWAADLATWTHEHRAEIARALRRDEPFSAEVLDEIAEFAGVSRAVVFDVLAAYRNAVP